ncbi:unnamed protein product [Dovyalis caffra]|uniref:Uncharacterized protein n=1 Tax=Dovyalis caffra TaxID=77055 RepID=A0AAV1QM83_9ROSI|nr:unnamed protein product [Dovyalis caffra]
MRGIGKKKIWCRWKVRFLLEKDGKEEIHGAKAATGEPATVSHHLRLEEKMYRFD